jgi:Uma2 family endonuclease
LKAGVHEVWQIVPEDRTIYIYCKTGTFRVLNANDTLTTPLLPGWELPLQEIIAA